MPQTQARDQHYVPSFLLARWATPPKRKGTLYELAVATGKVKATKPGNVSWQRDLYTVDKAANSSVLIVEAFLAIIEDCTADPIKNLSTLPTSISDEDRATIAFFLALQQFRAPAGTDQNRKVSELAAEAAIAAFLGNREAVTSRYRTLINPEATAEEVRAFARDLVANFKQGKLKIKLPHEAPQQAMLRLGSPSLPRSRRWPGR